MNCFCCASEEINLNISVDYTGIQFSSYNVGDSLYTFAKDNSQFTTKIKDDLVKAANNYAFFILKI